MGSSDAHVEPVAVLDGVTKRFGAVTAVNGVSLAFAPGEVHALLGENGAGKSTVVRLLAGVLQPDEGTVTIGGAAVADPREAIARGVATIYQDRTLVPQMTVAENIVLGHEPSQAAGVVVDRHAQTQLARESLRAVQSAIDPRTVVRDLSAADQQLVAIAKALSARVRLLIFDEPTAALTERETEHLFDLIRKVKADGVGVIYITHRLHEVLEIADRVSVFKDGRLQSTIGRSEATEDAMVRLMIGRDLGDLYPSRATARSQAVLDVVALGACDHRFRDVSLSVHAGEIVGVAGLEGSGKHDLAGALVGHVPTCSGTMTLGGRPYRPRDVKDAIDRGVAFVPSDRLREGLFANFTLRETISLTGLTRFSRFGVVQRRPERKRAAELAGKLRIKGALDEPIANLSGGNQQKALFARMLCSESNVLVLAEPTAGVDIGSRADIYALVSDLAADGAAIVVVSSDVTELLGLCHRIVVLRSGRPSAELAGAAMTEEAVIRAQLPVTEHDEAPRPAAN